MTKKLELNPGFISIEDWLKSRNVNPENTYILCVKSYGYHFTRGNLYEVYVDNDSPENLKYRFGKSYPVYGVNKKTVGKEFEIATGKPGKLSQRDKLILQLAKDSKS